MQMQLWSIIMQAISYTLAQVDGHSDMSTVVVSYERICTIVKGAMVMQDRDQVSLFSVQRWSMFSVFDNTSSDVR